MNGKNMSLVLNLLHLRRVPVSIDSGCVHLW